jgi:hypothetical protein
VRGTLAQIAPEGLVRDLTRRLTIDFSQNLDRHLAGATHSEPAREGGSLDGFALSLDLFRSRLRNSVRKIWSR